MTNYELMWAWLEDADGRLIEARTWLEKAWYHRVVRLSQECCELAQKALLAFYGLDVPKEHYLHKLVGRQPAVRRLPREVQRRLFESGRELSEDRIPSFYGGSDGTPPQALYDAERAQEALEQAYFVLETVKALIEAAGGQAKRPKR
nr:HEPN domain-containing protein [Anaerolineae bacterium]